MGVTTLKLSNRSCWQANPHSSVSKIEDLNHFFQSLYQSETPFREALCDSFNTPAAVDVMRDLISRTNVYINSRGKSLNLTLIQNISQWVGKILCMFGLGEGEKTELGWGQQDETGGNIDVCWSLAFPFPGSLLTDLHDCK
jgi:cysteinyl-tRNA synthetase